MLGAAITVSHAWRLHVCALFQLCLFSLAPSPLYEVQLPIAPATAQGVTVPLLLQLARLHCAML